MRLEARYFDGTSLEGRAVDVSLSPSFMTVRPLSGRGVLSAVPTSQLFELYRAHDGNRLDLGVIDNKDVRLMVEGDGVVAHIDGLVPDLRKQAKAHDRRATLRLLGIAALVLVGLVGLFLQLERLAPALIPLESEQEIGENLAASFLSGSTVCRGEEGMDALSLLTNRIAPPDTLPIPLTVQVIDSETVNAFALPGGQVVLFEGLIKKATSPEEVAGVLAHEIGHVEHRHALRRMVRAAGVGFLASMLSGGVVSDFSQQLVVLDFSREMEAQADEAALEALSDAGIAAGGFADFFDRLAEENDEDNSFFGGDAFESLLATHPISTDRSARIRAHPTPMNVSPALSDADWQALRNICKSLMQTAKIAD